jgi:sigma-B regulation protein RsbU (phosphoserine phosphatase)
LSDEPPVEHLDDLYENAPCGYVSLTPDGRIAKLNLTLANWLGRTPEELLTRKFHEILGFGGRIAFETHLAPMLRMQGHVDEIALELLDAGGAKVPVIANATEKRGPDDGHQFTRITLFRALDRRKYERSLVEARTKAEMAIASEQATAHLREQFIAVLGHDLRNPLAAIDAGTRLLGKEALSERGRFVVGEMARSVSRATLLIDNVLDFARGRLGEGLILARDAHEPLTPVLEQVVSEVRAIVPQRIIITRFAIPEPVFCDRQRLGQLAANLISNAITHGAPEIPVEVEARSDGDKFVLSVTNGGIPIPLHAQANLFQPFFRGSVRDSQQGLGLGLFIVDEIAKAHGGVMDVISTDAATRFSFSMPLANDLAS